MKTKLIFWVILFFELAIIFSITIYISLYEKNLVDNLIDEHVYHNGVEPNFDLILFIYFLIIFAAPVLIAFLARTIAKKIASKKYFLNDCDIDEIEFPYIFLLRVYSERDRLSLEDIALGYLLPIFLNLGFVGFIIL